MDYGFQVLQIICQCNLDSGLLKQKFPESVFSETFAKVRGYKPKFFFTTVRFPFVLTNFGFGF